MDDLTYLKSVDDRVFFAYLLTQDKYAKKIDGPLGEEIIRESLKSADQLVALVQGMSREKLIDQYGIQYEVRHENEAFDANYFGYFETPKQIVVFQNNIDLLMKGVKDPQIRKVDFSKVIFFHEFYHFLEESHPVYEKKVTAFQLGPFKTTGTLDSPSEIAANAFTKQVSGLTFNPLVYDYLSLLASNQKDADRFADKIRSLEGEHIG